MQAWFDRATAEATVALSFEGVRLEYQVEHHAVPSAAELDRLRRAVRDHPDHPARLTLSGYERRIKQGPDQIRYTLWFWSEGNWRQNYDDGSGLWFDTARTRRSCWRLGTDQLTLLDFGASPPPGFDLGSEEQTLVDSLRFLLHGGLHLIASMQLKPRPLQPIPDGWEVRADGAMESVLLFRGTWDGEIGRVRQLVLERAPSAVSEQGKRWVFDGWESNQLLGKPIAQQIDEFSPRSELLVRTRLLGTHAERKTRLDELSRTPSFDGSDPIRGALTVRAVSDYREASPLHSLVTADGLQSVLPPGEVRVVWSSRLRWLGWAILALLGVMFIWIRMNRRAVRRCDALAE
jgi:hypothetical protein